VEFVYNLLVVLHFIGLASLLGGFLVQMKSADKGVNPAMLHGALTQLITGVLLVGIASAGLVPGEEVDHAKIAVKLVIVLIITALAIVGRKRTPPQVGLWGAIGALTLVNVVIAVFWN
jgi:cytochrome bd-type quinol oxidase subunit 2